VSAVANHAPVADVVQLAERRARDAYGQALVAIARRGKVPTVELGHLAVRVLTFLLGQRPGYFAHQQVIAEAVESNLTSVRAALAQLRDAGLVSWELIPPHHQLPTGRYTRTNVNRYFVETDTLLRALGCADATPPRTIASTHPNSDASTCTDPKFEQDPPFPPKAGRTPRNEARPEEGELISKVRDRALATRTQRAIKTCPTPGTEQAGDVEPVLAAWRNLNLGEPDDRSVRALKNRLAEGTTMLQLLAAVDGASGDEWLRAGRAKVPFAIVFASGRSVERFATGGRERSKLAETLNRQRDQERRRARALLSAPRTMTAVEYAVLARKALKAFDTP
jgi:hypothetical protein